MQGLFDYDTKLPDAPSAVAGYRVCGGLVTGVLFAICTIILACYPLGKTVTLKMAAELEERRRNFATPTTES
jgi:Na+/melibiose symporter-like transporter